MDGFARSICLVTDEIDQVVCKSAHEFAQQGCRVQLLVASKASKERVAHCQITLLSDFPPIPYSAIRSFGVNLTLQRSEQIRHALVAMHQQHRFDLITFPERGALGFRTIQARRAGLCLTEVVLAVGLIGPSWWLRAKERKGLDDQEDLRNDFAEQYAFEHADLQLASSQSLADEVRAGGWAVRGDVILTDSFVPDGYSPTIPQPVETNSNVPLVTVVVTHYNLGAYLPEALASLAAQTYPSLEFIVVDDGSTDAASQQILAEQEKLYPAWRFIRTPNQGSGAARNQGLALAHGSYVLFFDADNWALPHLVSTLVNGLERNREVAALTCYVLGIRDHADPQQRQPCLINVFAGGPHVLACFENVYGDTTALFRVGPLRRVGGYETDRQTPWEDWMTYLRLLHAGYRVEVCPAFLFHYRVRTKGRTGQLEQSHADRERLVQILLQRYFSGPEVPSQARVASLWQAMARFATWSDERQTLRYRLVQKLQNGLQRWPVLHRVVKTLVLAPARLLRLLLGIVNGS